jgi:hypothetical protein
MNRVLRACAIFGSCVGLCLSLATAAAQTIIPVDRRLPPPKGFDFRGQWSCGHGPSAAHLDVREQQKPDSEQALAGSWTKLHESQQGFSGRYFIGYDQDKREFLMIDADDPASVSYVTDGWHGTKLTLISTDHKDQLMPPSRIVYEVIDPQQFTVTWEMRDDGAWQKDRRFTCAKVGD